MNMLKRGTARVDGQLIRELCARRGWELKELPGKIGYPRRTVQKWLAGGRAKVLTIKDIAQTFDINPQQLMPDLQPHKSAPDHASVSVAPTSQGMSISLHLADDSASPEDFKYLCGLLERAMSDYVAYKKAKNPKINVYYVPGTDNDGNDCFIYVVLAASLHDRFMAALEAGEVPEYAVIVEMGMGVPSGEIKTNMKRYYGFEHDDDK